MDLPHVDDHVAATRASPDRVWTSLIRTLRRTMGGTERFARMLDCSPAVSSRPFEGALGQTLPGFRVVDARVGRLLTLEGQHRFSRYRLTFTIDDHRVCARSDAAFPGVMGFLYRTVVIGSGSHGLLTRRMLRRIADGASDDAG